MTRPPILAEPEQRYWRRRANRRVRKARMTRNLLRWSVVFLLNGVIAWVLLYSGARAFQHLSRSEEFALRRIVIDGARHASAESIRAGVAPHLGRNLFELNLDEIGARSLEDPWVSRASVRRVLPDTLRISVTEREPHAVAIIGGIAHLVDSNGYVIGPTGTGLSENLPVLTGLPGRDQEGLVAALGLGVRLLDRLQRASPAFTDGISELELSRADRITVRTVAAGPKLLLDPERVERNILRYLEMRSALAAHVGPMEYVDLRWQDRISVMPAVKGR